MSQIRHIVYDIGKVLIHYDPDIPFKRLIPDVDERKWFFEKVCTNVWNLEQDRGRSWEEAEAELIARFPEQEVHIRDFRRHWHEMVPYHYADSVELMERLIDNGEDVTMLTNFAADTFDEVVERFAFLKRPRGVTVSGRVGLVKPEQAIYDSHVESFGLDPAATLFIDDSLPNVVGARDAGWQSVQFTGVPQLLKDLKAFDITV